MTAAIPIKALVARADRVSDVVAPQYDAIPPGGRYRFAVERPDSFVNITLSVGDFPDPAPPRSEVTRRATGHFAGMMERELFEDIPARGFFLYELDTGRHRQLGIVGAVPVSCVKEGRVVGHEGTITDRVADLAAFFRAARLASSPVALAFQADVDQRRLMERLASRAPIRDFTGVDRVRQRLWVVDDPGDVAEVAEATARIGAMYITDGHHRVAAASMDGVGPGWFLAILFPADHLHAIEYNRLVRLDHAPSAGQVIRSLGPDWETTELGPAGGLASLPRTRGDLAMLLGGVWHRLSFRGERSADPVESLDVSILHDRVLGPAFGVPSYEDPRLSYVVGGPSPGGLERSAMAYPGHVGFSMHPAQIEEIMAVADAGRLMPPKSTWFTPKPRSGLFVVPWSRGDVAAAHHPGRDRAPSEGTDG